MSLLISILGFDTARVLTLFEFYVVAITIHFYLFRQLFLDFLCDVINIVISYLTDEWVLMPCMISFK